MPLVHWKSQEIFFAHVPKTGGSSVEDYLIRRFGPLSLIDVNKRQGVKGTGLIVPVTHLAATDLVELIPPNVIFCFAVVRDPVARLMSEYRYQTNVSRLSRLGFSTWLRIMFYAARSEPRLYENHIRPQTELVPEGAEIYQLRDGFDALIAKLDKVTDSRAPEITVRHLNARKYKKIALSRQDVELISEFYAADYKRFDYPRPPTTQLKRDIFSFWRSWFSRAIAWGLVCKQRREWVR